jgi:hypothetical protein
MGGIAQNYSAVLPRKRVIRAEFNTPEACRTGFFRTLGENLRQAPTPREISQARNRQN